jgi:hypothetical protein
LVDIKALHIPMVPKRVRFRIEVAQGVPKLINLDTLRIHQILSNGLTNAMKVSLLGCKTCRVK